ncbi:uncharacterized protein [Mytilus edulis]|uniref:uncharacterized protein n=1 Tax=Mytilus edulis TaxID=6550 RepID=UPI0039F050A8
METFKKLLNAVVVLPFTAGEPSENHNSIDNIRPHDGSISGLVLLLSVFVIVILSMIGAEFVDLQTDYLVQYITVHSYLCIVIFLAIIVFVKYLILYQRQHSQITERIRPTSNVNKIFLWIFTIGSIVFSFAKIIRTIKCKNHTYKEFERMGCMDTNGTYYTDYDKVYISFQCIQIIFFFVQSCFVQAFIPFRFTRSWKNYYSLLLIVLANISQWAHYFVEIYRRTSTDGPGQSCNKTNYIICPTDNIVSRQIKPFFSPIKMEYFLFSMILIAQIWPSKQNHIHEVRIQRSNPESEYTPLLSTSDERIDRSGFNSLRTIFCVGFVALMIFPCFVFGYIKLSEDIEESSYQTIQNVNVAYHIFLLCSTTVLLIMSFYMISQSSSFLEPLMKTQHLHFHHKMIIASFLGSIAYCSLVIFACIHERKEYLIMCQKLMTMIGLYFQVVCILQLNSYGKKKRSLGEYVYLLLSILNLYFWIDDSIFEATSIYDKKILQSVYSITTQKLISHCLFPFFVFFRFKSFISFYNIFRQNPDNDMRQQNETI